MNKKYINYKNKCFFLTLISFFLLLTFSCSPKQQNIFETPQNNISIDRKSGYKYINPLLDCGIEFKEINPFSSKIRKYINNEIKKGNAKTVSVYFRHLNNGYWFGINEKNRFYPASMMKVPIMMEFLKIAEYYPNILNEKLIFNDKGNYVRNYLWEDSLVLGKEYPSVKLIERMIMFSDNYATSVLYNFIRNYYRENILFDELMIKNDDRISLYDSINAKDYAVFFRVLYNASFLNKEMSESALNLLSQTDFKNGLLKGIPNKEIIVAHKYGINVLGDDSQLHDCGIIYYPNQPYILCIMTKGEKNEDAKLAEIIAKISQMVYEEVDNQFKE